MHSQCNLSPPRLGWTRAGLGVSWLLFALVGCATPQAALQPTLPPPARSPCAIELNLKLRGDSLAKNVTETMISAVLRRKAAAEVSTYVDSAADLGALVSACSIDMRGDSGLMIFALSSPQSVAAAAAAIRRSSTPRRPPKALMWGQNLVLLDEISADRARATLSRWQPGTLASGELGRLVLDGQQVLEQSVSELRELAFKKLAKLGLATADLEQAPFFKPYLKSFDAVFQWSHQVASLTASVSLSNEGAELFVQLTPRTGTAMARFAQRHQRRNLQSLATLPAGPGMVAFSNFAPGAGQDLGLQFDFDERLPWSLKENDYLQRRHRAIDAARTGLTIFALYPRPADAAAGLLFVESSRPPELLRAVMEQQLLTWRRQLALDRELAGAEQSGDSILLPQMLTQVPLKQVSGLLPNDGDDAGSTDDDGDADDDTDNAEKHKTDELQKNPFSVLRIAAPLVRGDQTWHFSATPTIPEPGRVTPQLTATPVAHGVLLTGGSGRDEALAAAGPGGALDARIARALQVKDGPFLGMWIDPLTLPPNDQSVTPLLPLFSRLGIDTLTPVAGMLAVKTFRGKLDAPARGQVSDGISLVGWSTGDQVRLRLRLSFKSLSGIPDLWGASQSSEE